MVRLFFFFVGNQTKKTQSGEQLAQLKALVHYRRAQQQRTIFQQLDVHFLATKPDCVVLTIGHRADVDGAADFQGTDTAGGSAALTRTLQAARHVTIKDASESTNYLLYGLSRAAQRLKQLEIAAGSSRVDLALLEPLELDAIEVQGGILMGAERPILRSCKNMRLLGTQLATPWSISGLGGLVSLTMHFCSPAATAIWAHVIIPASVTSLSFHDCVFRGAPPAVPRGIRKLSMINCTNPFPELLAGLPALTSLTVAACGLADWPLRPDDLPALEILVLRDNSLRTVPGDIAAALSELDLSGNPLDGFPFHVVAPHRLSVFCVSVPHTVATDPVSILARQLWQDPCYGGSGSFDAASPLQIIQMVTRACATDVS